MKIPYSWLKEYINLDDVPPERVAELLTLRTCEVDAVHHVGGGLDNILIGEVVEAEKHPNADSLKVTKVNVGRGELLPIVCGAPNVAKGQKVAVAVPGAKLPNGLEITERKLRGEISRGMICSERELGLGDEHDGILVLEPDAVVGAKLTSLPSIEDWIIEIDNKSVNHRPDLWGIYGFVRELGAILKKDYKKYCDTSTRFGSGANGRDAKISIEAPDLCSRYAGLFIINVSVGPSPAWMQRRLRMLGARRISNVVDATNYVMFEIGQPTHAFDLDKIQGGRVLVRNASNGEKLETLDKQERVLQNSDLVIADGERAIGLAGVMGGANTEVDKTTKIILLESANFHAATVRRTAARLGLRSEASTRFEKTLDPMSTQFAVERMIQLLKVSFGADASFTEAIAEGPEPSQSLSIPLSVSFVRSRIGSLKNDQAASDAELLNPLERLGITVRRQNQDQYICDVPSYRSTKDITEPIDLVEEIARLRGYENVVPEPLVAPVAPPRTQNARRATIRRAEDSLVNLGFRSLESYSFLADSLIQQLGIENQQFVTLKNSLVVDQSRMRREVLPSLLGIISKNLQYEPDLRLFEAGKGYRPDHARVDTNIGAGKQEPQEIHSIAGIIAMGEAGDSKSKFNDGIFFRAKAVVTSLLGALALPAEFVTLDRLKDGKGAPSALPYIHPRRRILVGATVSGHHRLLGFVGELHPEVAGRLGLQNVDVAGFELDLEAIEAACAAAGPPRFIPIPKFPGITVDVALAAPENVSVEQLELLVRSADSKLCRSVSVFDIYRGPELGAGMRSVAFHVELRADDRTLNVADETQYLKSLAKNAADLKATLRGWQDK
ncbi:MAG: phenylalanine--tRNA ligase subunit beta [Planctomycetota bacterium]